MTEQYRWLFVPNLQKNFRGNETETTRTDVKFKNAYSLNSKIKRRIVIEFFPKNLFA